jgi:hypothetical protein
MSATIIPLFALVETDDPFTIPPRPEPSAWTARPQPFFLAYVLRVIRCAR